MLVTYIFDRGAQMHKPSKPERQDSKARNELGKAIQSNKRVKVQIRVEF